MKKLRNTLLLTFLLCLTFNLSQSQNKLFWIHQDNVKPAMVGEYKKISKEFIAACTEYNVQTSWITATTNDFKYLYMTPIVNMADLDQRPLCRYGKSNGR